MSTADPAITFAFLAGMFFLMSIAGWLVAHWQYCRAERHRHVAHALCERMNHAELTIHILEGQNKVLQHALKDLRERMEEHEDENPYKFGEN